MRITQAFTKPVNKATVYTEDGLNVDIRDAMEKIFPEAVGECIATNKIFEGKTPEETAALIWLFLRNECTYRRDPDTNQIIRRPSYLVNHFPHYGDCKTFALFSRAVYASIYPELETAFKFTSYQPKATQPTHVYTVVKDRLGRKIIIDGCWPRFNSEKNFTFELPLKFKNMKITSLAGTFSTNQYNANELLAGINDTATGDERDRIAKAAELRTRLETLKTELDGGHINAAEYAAGIQELRSQLDGINRAKRKKLTPDEKKAKRAARKQKAKDFFKKFGYGAAFVTLAPIRGAFASLIAMNLNGLASNMRLVKEAKTGNGWSDLKEFWRKVGGLPKALDKAIELGTKHKALWIGKKAHQKFLAHANEAGYDTSSKWLRGIAGYELDTINNPAIIAAALAAGSSLLAGALPIILKSLKQNGHTPELEGAQQTAQDLLDAPKPTKAQMESYANIPDESPAPDESTDEDEDEDSGEEVSGIQGISVICEWVSEIICDDATGAPAAGGFDFSGLINNLTNLATSGLKAGASAIENKVMKNPKVRAQFQEGDIDSAHTAAYLRGSGYPEQAKQFPRKKHGAGVNVMYVGGAAVAALLAAVLLKRKK